VVSGLARGIDTAAHEASLEEATIAVVAGGIDVVYPPENGELQERIARDGWLVTEMMPGTRPQAQHFPRRNRLISGMSLGIVVIEAAQRSGSLITARLALEQNREVFAVPGNPLDPRAAGTNHLIRDGAVLTRSARDVVDVLSPMLESPTSRRSLQFEEGASEGSGSDAAAEADWNLVRETIVSLIGTVPVEIDDLIRESGLNARIVMPVLLELEVAGLVERLPQQRVCAVP
jgi:DNA processing protein